MAEAVTRRARLTVSLAPEISEYVRATAERTQRDQSAVVEEALRRLRRDERRRVTQVALREDAGIDRDMAEAWIAADPPVVE